MSSKADVCYTLVSSLNVFKSNSVSMFLKNRIETINTPDNGERNKRVKNYSEGVIYHISTITGN